MANKFDAQALIDLGQTIGILGALSASGIVAQYPVLNWFGFGVGYVGVFIGLGAWINKLRK